MSELLETIQRRHQEALEHLQREEADEAFLERIHVLMDDVRQTGALIADPAGRGQLRALMRFWGHVLYEHTDVYPDTTLQPPDPERAHPVEEKPPRQTSAPFGWLFAGTAASILLLIAVLGVLVLGGDGEPVAAPTPLPTRRPLPLVTLAVGEPSPEAAGAFQAREVFCSGAPEVVADVELAEAAPATRWRWEVRRDGEVVDAPPEQRWSGDGERVTVLSDDGGVEAGRYELRVYVDDQLMARRTFRVLGTAPQVTDLAVADVPEPAGAASNGPLGAGTRVVYADYRHEGLCPGLELAHRLHREDELLQEIVTTWAGPAQGRHQVSFQASGAEPFPSGAYSVTVTVAGERLEQAAFAVGAPEVPDVAPSFGDVTVALGVAPDGTPILPAEETPFDWNTKVVYAIFEYAGMRDGVSWSAVWTRNDEEIARQEGLWDVDAFGTEGTRWVAHHSERGRTLSGGDYAVTLFIDGEAQRRRTFDIRYYVSE